MTTVLDFFYLESIFMINHLTYYTINLTNLSLYKLHQIRFNECNNSIT